MVEEIIMVKIISYNVNGIRAAIKKGFVSWLKNEQPDVICLQEIKANKDQFDHEIFSSIGYENFWHSAEKKGYSGVSILTKVPPKKIEYGTSINYIDILKIDTEGYEYNILCGLSESNFKNIKYIYFEHHYDLMITKNYKFNDINTLLKNNNFKLVFKIKMRCRKTFEYIYLNERLS